MTRTTCLQSRRIHGIERLRECRLRLVIMRVKTAGEAIKHCGSALLNEEFQVSLVLR